MIRPALLPLAALALVLTACDSHAPAKNAAAPAPASSGLAIPDNAAATPAAVEDPATAAPIHLTEKSSAIDFDYKIPARAAAIPALKAHLLADAETSKQASIRDHDDYAKALPADSPARPYGLEKDWSVIGETDQLLSLISRGYVYLGGAHGSDTFQALLWDKAANRPVPFAAMFTDTAKALATIRKPFCDTLNEERAKRRGGTVGELDDWSTRCPDYDDHVTLAFAHPVGGTFGRIAVFIPADIAGAHAEGNYTYELFIPEAMIPLIAPEWRASFPGG